MNKQQKEKKNIFSILLFVCNESPQIHLQIVSVHLNLLKAKLTERPQANTLQ